MTTVFDDPRWHLMTRGVAAFVFAPYLLSKGFNINDPMLITIGYLTMFYDTYTFILTMNQVTNVDVKKLNNLTK